MSSAVLSQTVHILVLLKVGQFIPIFESSQPPVNIGYGPNEKGKGDAMMVITSRSEERGGAINLLLVLLHVPASFLCTNVVAEQGSWVIESVPMDEVGQQSNILLIKDQTNALCRSAIISFTACSRVG